MTPSAPKEDQMETELTIEEQVIVRMEEITQKLNELEKMLNENGYKGPTKHIEIEKYQKIRLPLGYIRKVSEFRNEYKLFNLVDDKKVIDNIAYSLQMSDFFNYLLNRFNFFLSIEQYFNKYAITNLFSSYEALLHAILIKLHKYCVANNGEICKYQAKCKYYINSPKQMRFNKIVDLFTEKFGISYFEQQKENILLLKELRDNIHIWQAQYNEYSKQSYTVVNYNKMMKILHYCKHSLPEDIYRFRRNRSIECSNKSET